MTCYFRHAALALCLLAVSAVSVLAQSPGGDRLINFADRAFDAGRMEDAVRGYSKAMESGALTKSEVAFALYRRGAAYSATGRNALAVADLTKALWLKELKGKARSEAYRVRGEAYAALGRSANALNDLKAAVTIDSGNAAALKARGNLLAKLGKKEQAARDLERAAKREAAAKAKPDASGSVSAARRAAGEGAGRIASGEPTLSASEPEPRQSGGSDTFDAVTDYIGSLFSSSPSRPASKPETKPDTKADTGTAKAPRTAPPPVAAKPKPPEAPTRPEPRRPARPKPPEHPSTSWTTSVEREAPTDEGDGGESTLAQVGRFFGSLFSSESEEGRVDAEPAAVRGERDGSDEPQTRPDAKGKKQFNLQLASLKTAAEAKASLKSIVAKHGDLLAGRKPQIKPTKIDGLGTFYLVMLGPFEDRRSSLKLCNSFKQKGVRCFLVAN